MQDSALRFIRYFLAASALVVSISAQAFEIKEARVAPWQTQTAPGQTAHLTRTGYYPVAAMPPKTAEEFDPRFACIKLSVDTAPGSAFEGWEIRRIRLQAGCPVAGNVLVDVTYDDLMLVENSGKYDSITLDVLNGSRLGSGTENYYVNAYPAGTASLSVCYFLRRPDGRIETLSHALPSVTLEKGRMSVIRDILPASVQNGWTLKPHKPDIELYRKAIASIISRAGLPSMQVTLIDNVDTVMLCEVNRKWYDAHPERKKEIRREFDMQSIYQACSISKTPCCYIYMKMASDGEVDLDKPLYEYYPGLLGRFKPQYRGRVKLITGRMALSHISGGGPGYSNMPLDFYPGYHYDYRNSNTCMLQWTIEYLKRAPLDSVATHYIFGPREMPTTSYTWIPAYDSLAVFSNKGLCHNHGWENNKWGTPEPEFWWAHDAYNNNASFHLRTNSVEFSRFLQSYLTGAGLSEDIYNQMMCPVVRTSNNSGTCWRSIGSWVMEDNPEMGRFIMHTGSNGTFKGVAMIFPERNTTLSCFANGSHIYNLWKSVTNELLAPKIPFACFVSGEPLPPEKKKDK